MRTAGPKTGLPKIRDFFRFSKFLFDLPWLRAEGSTDGVRRRPAVSGRHTLRSGHSRGLGAGQRRTRSEGVGGYGYRSKPTRSSKTRIIENSWFLRISIFSHWILTGCWDLDWRAPPGASVVVRRCPTATRHIRDARAPSRLESVGGGRGR